MRAELHCFGQLWQIRQRIYQQQLKYLLDSIKKMGWAMVALLQTAIPVLAYAALYCLGQIAEPSTANFNYVLSLSFLLFMLFALLRLQQIGITGKTYQYFLASLPTNRIQRGLVNFGLLSVAGNVFIWAPTALLLFMLKQGLIHSTVFWSQASTQLLPITSCVLLIWYISWVAAFRQFLPVISLLIYPVVGLLIAEFWPAYLLQLSWLVVASIEPSIMTRTTKRRFTPQIKVKHYWQMLVLADIANIKTNLSRLLACAAALFICNVFYHSVSANSATYSLVMGLFILSLLIASSQFDLLRFETKYHYFLASRATGWQSGLGKNQLYLLAKQALLVAILSFWLPGNITTSLVLIGLVISSNWAIRRFKSHFFILPLALTCGLLSLVYFDLLFF